MRTFNAETSNKILERWETAFKHKIINQAKSLTSTAEIQCLLSAAGGQGSENGRHDLWCHSFRFALASCIVFLYCIVCVCVYINISIYHSDWDSDISSILLLHILPPSSGRKTTKISPTEAVDRLVHFHNVKLTIL